MKGTSVSIREFKRKLRHYPLLAKTGETAEISEWIPEAEKVNKFRNMAFDH
jgi:hypothetical protein